MFTLHVRVRDGREFCTMNGRGLYVWSAAHLEWRQVRGTGQTPLFRTSRQLRRYLTRHGVGEEGTG